MTNETKRPTAAAMVRRVLRVTALAYLGFVALLYFAQDWLVFPGRRSQGRAEANVRAPTGTDLVELSIGEDHYPAARRTKIVALFAPVTPTPARAPLTVLWFYGNGMSLVDTVDQALEIRDFGVNVFAVEYPGYGMSEGAPSERAFAEAADAAFAHLVARKDVRAEAIVVGGWSIGGAVAIDLATRHRVAGVAAMSPFTRLPDVAKRQWPYVPVGWLLRSRFDNAAKVAGLHVPIFLAHGAGDPLVPATMCDRLAALAAGPVTKVVIPGAHHDDLFVVGGPALWGPFRDWLRARAAEAP